VNSNISSDSGSGEDEELSIPQNADVWSNILKGTLVQACKSELGTYTYQVDSSSFNNKIQI